MPTRCHCERASSRLTAPADRSPEISTRVTWFLSSSGRSKVASARVSPSPSVKAVSPSRCPRADTACRTPARDPPSARSTCASRRPSAATPAEVASASTPGRVSTIEKPPPASSCSRSANRRVWPSWSMPSASQTTVAVLVSQRRGQRLDGGHAVRRERLRLQRRGRRAGQRRRLDFQVGAARGTGRRHDHHRPALSLGLGDQPLDQEGARRPLRGGGPAVVDHQHHRAGAAQRLVAVRVQHRLGQRQDDERGRQHADQRQPPGRLRGRLLAVLDADQDAGRREREAPRLRRHRAQQPPDDRQCQDTSQQPRTEERDRPERHAAPSAVRPSDFQR